MNRYPTAKSGIARVLIVVIVLVVIFIVALGAYVAVNSATSTVTTTPPTTTASSSSSSFSSLSSSSSVSSQASSSFVSSSSSESSLSTSSISSTTSSAVSTTSSSGTAPSTLTIDDWNWPIDDLNQLYGVALLPWPNWMELDVYQPLITLNASALYGTSNFQYLPSLAQNWTVSSDGMTYTFNLRPNVTFSDGNAFNSYQIWMEYYGFYYLSGNSSTWLMAYNLFDMSKVTFGPATIAAINQSGGVLNPAQPGLGVMMNSSWPIYVTGPSQIVFRLKAPFFGFLGTLVQFEGMLFDTQFVLDHGGFGTPSAFNNYFNQNPIPGTGPYEVTGVSENNYVSFTQNPTYWGRGLTAAQIGANPYLDPGHVKNVVVNYKADDVARYTDLSTGAAQIAAIQASNWNLITANSNVYSFLKLPSTASLMIAVAMNVNIYPTNITLVRQAIAHAINYSQIYKVAFHGQMSPLVGPEYPGWKQFYDLGSLPPYQYNTTLAVQDMLAAKLTNIPQFTFRVPAGCSFCNDVAQIVQTDLGVLNITTNIEVLSFSSYIAPYGSYSTNVANAQQMGQLALLGGEDWASFLASDNWDYVVGNQSGWGNWAGYSNPTVQACANSFTATTNVTMIQSLCQTAQKQIYDDAPYAWIGVDQLVDGGGSVVWKNSVISKLFMEPAWGGENTAPVFNTVTFA